jgi:kinesin family member 3A
VIELHDDLAVPKIWPYDFVFGNDATNEHVFNFTAKKLVSSALDGFNTVLFMYGQTSSGTMNQ